MNSFYLAGLKSFRGRGNRNRAGFALMELFILLIITGLVVGGFFIVKDLVRTSEINSIIARRDSFNAAVAGFKDKYNCLPADCKNNEDLGFVQDNNYYHKGDGIVDNDEKIFFWDILSAAEFIGTVWSSIYLPKIAENADGKSGYWDLWSPKDPIITASGDGTFTSLPGKNYYWLHGEVEMFSFPYKSAAIFTPIDAYDIDIKIDDGLPLNGNVQASGDKFGYKYGNADNPGNGPWTPVIAMLGSGDEGCLVKGSGHDDVEEYNILNKDRTNNNLCSLLIKAGF